MKEKSDVDFCVSKIQALFEPVEISLSDKTGKDVCSGMLSMQKGTCFQVVFETILRELEQLDGQEYRFILGETDYVIQNGYFSSKTASYGTGSSSSSILEISQYKDSRLDMQENYFIRGLFSTDKILPQLTFIFSGETRRNGKGVLFPIDEVEYYLYYHEDKVNERRFVAVESLSTVNDDEFDKALNVIINCFGFLTGLCLGNGLFKFYSKSRNIDHQDNLSMSFSAVRPEFKHYRIPIYTNPYGKGIREEVDYKSELKLVELEQLRLFGEMMYHNPSFRYTISLINEASYSTLNIQASGYSIALEALANIFTPKEAGLIYPIKEEFRKDIINSLLEQIDINRECFTDYDKIRNRILSINQPINKKKLTNDERLRIPFLLEDIPLNNSDNDALKIRNDLLHGNVSLKRRDETVLSTEASDKRSLYFSFKLYFLLSALVMRKIGFKGRILNYLKINEKMFVEEIKEDYYRRIK